jgi:hypothetical protein
MVAQISQDSWASGSAKDLVEALVADVDVDGADHIPDTAEGWAGMGPSQQSTMLS